MFDVMIKDLQGGGAESLTKTISTLMNVAMKIEQEKALRVGSHGFDPLDARGEPVYNVKLLNDTETAGECLEIMEAYGGKERMIREVGNPVLPGFTAGKIRWLKKNRPEVYEKLARILLPHDYINYYLTGRYFTEVGDASGTAYFDIYKKRWSGEVLKAIDPDTDLYQKLPEVIGNCTIGGYLTEERSRDLGLPAGIPVFFRRRRQHDGGYRDGCGA